MTTARTDQVDIDTTPYYHCVTRCVRRAFLCGEDYLTGRNFNHRKQWIIERLQILAEVFTIDICAYAIMSNHLHVVLHVAKERCLELDESEVIERVRRLFPACLDDLDTLSAESRTARIEKWRERLWSMSWFMRCLNEYIARMANKEDECTGRFWEGRFKSQALLDEGALLASMAYVDLNPVRAGLAKGLEDSSWTSIKQRLNEVTSELKIKQKNSDADSNESEEFDFQPDLAKFIEETANTNSANILPINFDNYVELLEWTGRAICSGKKGHITSAPKNLLSAKGLNPENWLESLQSFERFSVLVGASDNIKKYAPNFGGRNWAKGLNKAKTMYQRVV